MMYEKGAQNQVCVGTVDPEALELLIRRYSEVHLPRRWRGGSHGPQLRPIDIFVATARAEEGARILEEVMLCWKIFEQAKQGCTTPWKDRKLCAVNPLTRQFAELPWLQEREDAGKPTSVKLAEQMGRRILRQAWANLEGRTLAEAGVTTRAWDPDRAEVRRVSGDAMCGQCKRKYRSHPKAEFVLDNEGVPFLRLGCDGDLLKL